MHQPRMSIALWNIGFSALLGFTAQSCGEDDKDEPTAVSCSENSSCPAGQSCTPKPNRYDPRGDCFRPNEGSACESFEDECTKDQDCTQVMPEARCVHYESEKKRYCVVLNECPPYATVGRPFLIEGHAEVAPQHISADWTQHSLSLSKTHLGTLSSQEKRLLAEYWLDIGLMEHASIAAFARFAMQLLSLGAPPELVQNCTKAMKDETRHALHCFAIARAFSGVDVGPGPLKIMGAMRDDSLEEIIDMVIYEGCIGETTAALEAHEAALRTQDPTLRHVLEGIARDEREHGALAWNFLRWLLRTEKISPHTLQERFDFILSQRTVNETDDVHTGILNTFGKLSPMLRASLHRSALSEVIRPTLRALLSEHETLRAA